ncbi:amino acid adenylation domain-containing protein [Streptomyces sp. SID12501]|uniref:Amino acid adenylation domain-containing protein n=1 Tax=Streptomyces sp. SID12501 TaxID=2706042 RepID=A0A6B3C4G1_9ACTN|nr:amino acid adenylation domain-containing protein [Streptomyces sp. SID12501]NEC91721.1 amino acid adenylation domain-containing protein [Streptomyces sp. SID12501]
MTASLAEAFTTVAATHPDRTAVRNGPTNLTYRQLDLESDALAAAIQERASGPRPLTGVLLERGHTMVVAALAALKAGGSYLPLDPASPPERLKFILQDAEPALVITSDTLSSNVPAGIPVLLTETCAPGSPEPVATAPDDRAYIIYTSGTTGRPKGVEISHRNALVLFTATDGLFGFRPDDIWSLFHSYAFDFSVWEMWGPLLTGGTTVVVPTEVARDPAAFRRLLRDEQVTVLSQTPTAFHQLAAEDEQWADRLPLRTVVFGGEALRPSDLKGWAGKYSGSGPSLINMYGITETTVHASYRVLSPADLGDDRSLIGGPLPGSDLLLVDDALAPVPDGTTGEVIVVGPQVGLGYLGRPELTAQRFVELCGPDGRLVRGYRSGDLACRTQDGGLEYLGRADNQVKIRGFRIELGEIESVLGEHPSVRQAVVTVRDAGTPDATLVGYVVPAPGEIPDGRRLRAHLASRLPEYMLPSATVVLEALPLTVNGKLDRAALPAPSEAEPAPAEPGSEIPAGQRMTAVFAEVLGRPGIGPDDDFFEQGGHSLLALRLVNRVRARFASRITLQDVYEAGTATALADLLRDRAAQ